MADRIEITGDAVDAGTTERPATPAPHAPDADGNVQQDSNSKPSPAPEEQKPDPDAVN